LIGEQPSGDTEQPQPRLGPARDVADPAPGDEVHLREEIRRVLRALRPPQQIREDRQTRLRVQLLESLRRAHFAQLTR
jgi:hypothetical protein